MKTAMAWQAGEDCPDCGAALALLDDGTSAVWLDCGSCGYTDMRALTDPAGGGGW